MHDKLKQIRTQLRLSMNGIVSTSMRYKGASYKLNFGVSLPKLKEIALTWKKNAELAESLWSEDVREMKILATLLQPFESFTREKAEAWAESVNQQEIAEQYAFNLLQYLPFAEELAAKWIENKKEYISLMGFLLFTHILSKRNELNPENTSLLLNASKRLFEEKASPQQRVAITALKRLGKLSPANKSTVLSYLSDYSFSDSLVKKEIYEDIQFELDYYE